MSPIRDSAKVVHKPRLLMRRNGALSARLRRYKRRRDALEVLMKVTDVRAVIAIGLRGQFGLRGRLPWEGNRGREYVADVECFFELTRGHVVIMGQRTFTSVPDFAFKDRDILEIHASDRPEDVLARFPSRVVFIGAA